MIVVTDWTQQVFRFYEDGTESGSSATAAQNTNITRTSGTDSANLALRIAIWDGLGSGGAGTDDYQLQYSKNGGGYTNVTTSSSNVKGYNSSNLTDGNATTQRLTGASGSFGAGEISEDGLVDDLLVNSSNNTELLFSLTVVYADLSNGNTLDFRVLRNGSVISYSVTPRITASIPAGNVYNETGSGGTQAGSTGSPFVVYSPSVTGGTQGGSTGTANVIFAPIVASGGFSVGGDSPAGRLFEDTASGGMGVGGDGAYGVSFFEVGGETGGFTVGGESEDTYVPSSGGSSSNRNVTREVFTPCCVRTRPRPGDCCACSEAWQFYKLKPENNARESVCSVNNEFINATFTWTKGCTQLDNDWFTVVGWNYAWPLLHNCNSWNWQSYYNLHPALGGPTSRPAYEFCCYGDLGGTQCMKSVGWSMGCTAPAPSNLVPALTHWEGVGPYCVGCADGLYCGPDHAIEYGNIEACEAEYGVGNCSCCGEEEPVHHISEEECIYYGCTSCVEVVDYPAFYTPPTPARWFLGYGGPCGCLAVWISTTSDDPIYGFYEPTSGLDATDECGNFYYRHFGALDATGPFSCTSGGRFTLVNLVQPGWLFGDCSGTPITNCFPGTNLYMGYDSPCAGKECADAIGNPGGSGSDCEGYGCANLPIYIDVEPLENLRQLPDSNWWPNLQDPTGNMFCCPSSGSTSNPYEVIDMEALSVPMNEAVGDKLYFTWGIFQGEVVGLKDGQWYVNYPPINWLLEKKEDDYFLNGEQMTKVNDWPLMLELKHKGHLLEITQ